MAFQNFLRIQRSGQLAKDEQELKALQNKRYIDEKDEKRILFLIKRIAKNKERQKIASENNTKQKTKTIDKSRTANFNSEINGVKFNDHKKHLKK